MKTLLLLLICFIASCGINTSKNIEVYLLPQAGEINEIIRTVLLADTLPMEKYFHRGEWKYDSVPNRMINDTSDKIILELRKINVVIPSKNDPIDYWGFDKISVNHLLECEYRGEKIFNYNDSLFLLFQSDTIKQFSINSNSLKQFTFVTKQKYEVDIKGEKIESYYELSIPIFSKDLKRTYLEINHFFGTSGGGYVFVLEKQNGKWKITGVIETWVS